jgi:hypothetical protein
LGYDSRGNSSGKNLKLSGMTTKFCFNLDYAKDAGLSQDKFADSIIYQVNNKRN